MKLIDGDKLMMSLADWWFSSFGEDETEESKAIHTVMNKVEESLDTFTVPQWIPVTERLPDEEKKTYWVCTNGGDQHECRWTNVNPIWTNATTDWHWNIFDIPQFSKVIAWMPLPEPWRGEEE